MREKLCDLSVAIDPSRITPACAGKTKCTNQTASLAWDHPRVCGKNSNSMRPSPSASGSPPRVREKHWVEFVQTNQPGITPACAGKTSTLNSALIVRWDHPRVCGKNALSGWLIRDQPGSPPRVREKQYIIWIYER